MKERNGLGYLDGMSLILFAAYVFKVPGVEWWDCIVPFLIGIVVAIIAAIISAVADR